MPSRSRPETAVRHALWLGGLLVVLGGLFGMHGLDSHGAGVDSVMHATVGGMAGAVGYGDMVDTAPGAAPATIAVAWATGGIGMDMAMGMCVAVLGLGLIASLLRIWASRRRPLMRLMACPVHAPGVRGRDRDPPSLTHLSIQRC